MEKTKRYFISDIHLNDSASMKANGDLHPWSWCSAERAGLFADFIKELSDADDAAELIILGDLFDGWMCPACIAPGSVNARFESIANAPENMPALDALRDLIRGTDTKVSYVPGNHDMLMTGTLLAGILPGVRFLGTAAGLGVYEADGIHAEHGNLFSLFTSPDFWTVPGSVLPLGYYDTRALAEALARNGVEINMEKIISQLVVELGHKDGLAGAIYRALCGNANMNEGSDVIMNHLDNMPDSLKVGTVETRYGHIFEEWSKRWPNDQNVPVLLAVISDTGHLLPAAIDRFFSRGKAGIVIFGHTHDFSLRSPWQLPFIGNNSKAGAGVTVSHIYANCGAWVDQKRATFIETEIDAETNKHHVRLKAYEGCKKTVTIDELSTLFKPSWW